MYNYFTNTLKNMTYLLSTHPFLYFCIKALCIDCSQNISQNKQKFLNLWRSFHVCGRLKTASVVELTELNIPFLFDLKALTYRSSFEIGSFSY